MGLFGSDPFLEDAPSSEEISEDIGSTWYFNGVTEEGTYGMEPMEIEKLARLISGKPAPEDFSNKAQQEHFEQLDDDQKALLEVMTPEQKDLYYALIAKPEQLYKLQNEQNRVFQHLSPAQQQAFKKIIEEQLRLHNDWIAAQKEKLLEAFPDKKDALAAMLAEAWQREESKRHLGELAIKQQEGPYPLGEEVSDPFDLAQTGWGIIFPASMAAERVLNIESALAELLELRKGQAGKLFHIYKDSAGYRPNETKAEFFQRHRVGAGVAHPEEMPFYLLLVGNPEEIPYEFQYQVDVMRGVGRIDFGDDYAAYARYAHNVALAESGQVKLARNAGFFAVKNPGDKATELSQKYLISALLEDVPNADEDDPSRLTDQWKFTAYEEKKATHAQLGKLLGGDAKQTPAFLFTASHGMEFNVKSPDKQRKYQGALVCQDWGGPKGGGIDRGDYFAGEDVPADANLLGMVALFFACYGAGTPKMDQFAAQAFKERKPITPEGFVADLPKQMLLKGALAVIGHVERAWGYSFMMPDGTKDNKAFIGALRLLLNGSRIGWATDSSFNMRYADMSSELSVAMESRQYAVTPDQPYSISDHELARRWTANNDARGYVVIGDPAAYIPFAKGKEKPTARVDLGAVNFSPASGSGTSAAPKAIAQAAGGDLAATDFGLGEQISGLKESLKEFSDKIAEAVGKATRDITTLEVKTYGASNLNAISADSEAGAELRALTHVDFDGDMKIFVPTKEGGGVDQDVWQIHMEMVREAQANRAQFIGTMAEMAANLLKSLT